MLDGTYRSKHHTARTFLPGRSRRGSIMLGMRAALWEKDAPAQGMVEFALVLPILLLIIFGIIAFGHFFFSYSLVVAASREAARFGAAVGLTENSIPRYRDCAMIRDAARFAGELAGVDGTDSTVQISYDQGPKLDGTTVVYTDGAGDPVGCPIDDIGPGFIELGDRIVVTVTVTYQPIVPMVITNNIPLTATTRRTIMLGMPVGEQPIAEQSECIGTLTRIVPPMNSWNTDLIGSTSLVGEPVEYLYEVIADDPDETAQGHIYLYLDDVLYATSTCDADSPYSHCTITFNQITPLDADPLKPHILRASYDPQAWATGTPCYDPSKAEPLRHFVLPADTELTILSINPSPSEAGEEVTVTVAVKPVAPAGGIPTGPVYVEEDKGKNCEIILEDVDGVATGSCSMVLTAVGKTHIAATYDPGDPGENPNYNSSSAAADHEVNSTPENPGNPMLICPAASPSTINVTGSPNSISAQIVNNNPEIPLPINAVTVTWPDSQEKAYLQFVRVNNNVSWTYDTEYGPTSQTVALSGAYVPPNGAITTLALDFSGTLPAGPYTIAVDFSLPDPGLPPLECQNLLFTGVK